MDSEKIKAATPLAVTIISGVIACLSLFSPNAEKGLAVAGIGLAGACGLARSE